MPIIRTLHAQNSSPARRYTNEHPFAATYITIFQAIISKDIDFATEAAQ